MTSIQIEKEDMETASEAALKVQALTSALGEEVARHERVKADLIKKIEDASREYGSVVQTLSKRYIKDRGQYAFRPELGAFVAMQNGGKVNGHLDNHDQQPDGRATVDRHPAG